MGAAQKNDLSQTQARKDHIVCFEYRDALKTDARTEYIPLIVDKSVRRLEPLWRKRSRTGAHGEDCYTKKYLEKANAVVEVRISNSGRHYCSLILHKQLTSEQLLKLAKWLYEHEHICESIAKYLLEYGLPEDVLVDLIMPDP